MNTRATTGRTTGNTRTAFAILLFFALSGGAALASTPATSASFDSDLELQAALESARQRHDLPGISAAYILPDGVIVHAAAGLADVERAIPMTTRTRMLAASIGKTFVAATAAALAEDGIVDLDAPVSTWLHDRTWFSRVPNHATITLRHLLDHTAGLPDHVHTAEFARALVDEQGRIDTSGSAEKWIGFVLDRPAVCAPGEGFAYSDTGYLIAGLALESATGRDLHELVTEKFVDVLRLDSTIPSNRPDLPGLACSYVSPTGPLPFPRRTTNDEGVMVWDPAVEGAGGGLASTPTDLVRWARWAFEQGPTRLDTVTPMETGDEGVRYGMGIAFHAGGHGGATAGHAGWIPGTISSLRYYRERGIAVAFQVNTDEGASRWVPELERELARLAFDQSKGRAR